VRTDAVVAWVLAPLKGVIHLSRLKCLSRFIAAALVVGRVSLTAVGRALPGTAKTKHNIKRVDALLGNKHLVADAELVQQHFAEMMANVARPVLLVDWTDIGTLWTALVVTYATEGRGLILCWDVHHQTCKNSPKVESSVLKRIAALIPAGVKPILTTDAGFRGPWMKKVRARGWDFIGRVRGKVNVRAQGEQQWQKLKSLWVRARHEPKDLGLFELARSQPITARLVTLLRKKTKKPWKNKKLPAVGRRKQRNIKSAREPLILMTSLPPKSVSASKVADLYALRWRIEMAFRDHKCGRFGLGLDLIRTKTLLRAQAYFLLAALAHYVAFVLGTAAHRADMARAFQANTSPSRVLSLFRLGCELLRRSTSAVLAAIVLAISRQAPLIPSLECGDP